MTTRGSPRVSVVVAAYNSPPELDRLVASLDAQSLAPAEYEAIFVDDGSSDGTLQRLHDLAAERPYMQVYTIENSGWPGKPRNVGTVAARGEYVFYADHDDYFFPEALERMVRFATAHDLDVVHPKEVVEGWSAPGWTTWRAELPRIPDWTPAVVDCITPHKLYRKSFLEAQRIGFPEGKIRVEDFSFNAAVWSATDAVGVLSGYPCYRWTIYDDNSHKKAYDFESYWADFESSLQPLVELPNGCKRYQLLVRWYRSRVLERLAGIYSTFNADYRAQLNDKFTALLEYFPIELDPLLTAADRHRSHLLRMGDFDALLALSEIDLGMKLQLRAPVAIWSRGALSIKATGLLVDANEMPVRFLEGADGALYRDLPGSLAGRIPESILNIQGDLRRSHPQVLIRGRRDNVDWYVPSSGRVMTVDHDGAKAVSFEFTATIDPRVAAFGEPLTDEVWDVFARLPELGYTATHRLRTDAVPAGAALVHGRQAIAYRTKPGYLALDLGSNVRTVLGTAQPAPEDVNQRGGNTLVVLRRVHVAGITRIEGILETPNAKKSAVLENSGRSAVLRIAGRQNMTGGVRAVFNGRRSAPLMILNQTNSSAEFTDIPEASTPDADGNSVHLRVGWMRAAHVRQRNASRQVAEELRQAIKRVSDRRQR